jgi:hypothetical protein
MNKTQKIRRMTAVGVGLASAAVASAHADGPDVTTVVAAITALIATVGLIGNADLLVQVAIKGYKWVRRALG